jgi:hypothetical protein
MFRKVFKLSAAEKLVLLQAAAWLIWVRLVLAILPFALVQRLVFTAPRTGRLGARSFRALRPARIGYLVAAAATRIPRTTCLPRALATRILLGRHGHAAELRIGVDKDHNGGFEAHAWVEAEGKVVIGGPEVSGYKPILRTA